MSEVVLSVPRALSYSRDGRGCYQLNHHSTVTVSGSHDLEWYVFMTLRGIGHNIPLVTDREQAFIRALIQCRFIHFVECVTQNIVV